jgi:hypothetical protein
MVSGDCIMVFLTESPFLSFEEKPQLTDFKPGSFWYLTMEVPAFAYYTVTHNLDILVITELLLWGHKQDAQITQFNSLYHFAKSFNYLDNWRYNSCTDASIFIDSSTQFKTHYFERTL